MRSLQASRGSGARSAAPTGDRPPTVGLWALTVLAAGLGITGLGTTAASAEDPSLVGDQPQLRVDVITRGSSSLLGIRKAKAAVPTQAMPGRNGQLVDDVLSNLSIYRRLPDIRCEADPRVLDYFLNHPDVAVGIWRALGVSSVQLTQTGPDQYLADDGAGSKGNLSVLYRDAGQQVIFCDGVFLNPVNKQPIQARAVIHFRHRGERSRDGRLFTRHDATMFVSLPSHGYEAVARAISPISNKLADRNFQEVSLFVRMMSLAMTEQPDWVADLSDRIADVPADRCDRLATLAGTIHSDAYGDRRRRVAAQPGGAVTR